MYKATSLHGLRATVRASVASNVTTYTATGLTNGTAYSFQIKAVYSQGESEVATIQATPEAEAVVYNPVTEFQAAASYKSVVLSWTAPVAAEKTTLTGYSIQVSGSEQPIVIEDPETVTYTRSARLLAKTIRLLS